MEKNQEVKYEKPELITLRNLRTLRTLRITTSKKSTHTVNNLNSSPYATYASQQVHRHWVSYHYTRGAGVNLDLINARLIKNALY